MKPTIEEKKKIKKIKTIPMSNFTIEKYHPDVKTVSYNDLKNIRDIDELIPEKKGAIIILYQLGSFYSGHWVALLKYKNKLEYFDPLGYNVVDTPLSWNSREQNERLGINEKYLSKLLLKARDENKKIVISNPIPYQSSKSTGGQINTCGRHCCLRIQKMKENLSLPQYYKLLSELKKKANLSYDDLVSSLITKTTG